MAETAKTSVVVRAGAPVAGLIPRSIEEAWRLAQALAGSEMVPRDMQRPEKILVAIMGGAEIGLPPFQALQSFAIINGRPTLWGDGLLGVVRARGVQVKEWFEGAGDDMIARCEVTRPDTGEMIAGEFSVEDAKKAGLWGKNGPWSQYPKRMLKMRARAFAIRDGCADILRGIQVREEVEDYQVSRDVTPPAAMLAIEAQTEAAEIEVVDGPPIPPAPPEPSRPEIIDAKSEATALKESYATKWAATWRERISDPDLSASALSTSWSAPQNNAARDKARRENSELERTVAAEVMAAIEVLETQ